MSKFADAAAADEAKAVARKRPTWCGGCTRYRSLACLKCVDQARKLVPPQARR